LLSILTNFGPGFGPLVRTFDMARRIRLQLEMIMSESICIIVPWVYGEHQLRVLKEETSGEPGLRGKVFLSPDMGDALRPLLFSGKGFNVELNTFLQIYEKQKTQLERLLKSPLKGIDIKGNLLTLEPEKIQLEVARNPVVSTGIKNSYYSSVGYCSSIFEELLKYREVPGVDYKLLVKAISVARKTEADFCLHFQPVPRCLSFRENSQPLYETERETPPLIPLPKVPKETLEKGMYVSVSGIPGLSSLYQQALQLPQTVFTNDRSCDFTEGQNRPPAYIAHPSIERVFARAAWNTIWLANLTGTPLVCPDYTKEDHPEIFFNLKTIAKIGLAYTWDHKNVALEEFLTQIPCGKQNTPEVYERIRERFGTLDGLDYCVNMIIEDFLNAG